MVELAGKFDPPSLQESKLQGFKINANLDQLKKAKLILNDSVGAGMTRSSFLQKL